MEDISDFFMAVGPLIAVLAVAVHASHADTLSVSVDGMRLERGGEGVFLNGLNLAWISYGSDFNTSSAVGYGGYVHCMIRDALRFVRDNGGNSLRVWMFSDLALGAPLTFDAGGNVSGLRAGVLETAVTLLDMAHDLGIYVVLSLWNGALVRAPLDCSFYADAAKLDSFIAKALTPLALALSGHPALAMWEIVNEPEGVLELPDSSTPIESSPCSDVQSMAACAGEVDPPGWNIAKGGTCSFPLSQLQRFINVQVAALKAADPTHLVSVGSWSACAISSLGGGSAVFAPECLVRAGGQPAGVIDVWQIHSYPKEQGGSAFAPNAPFLVNASAYGLRGPILIGEVSNRWSNASVPSAASIGMASIHANAKERGYVGVLSWAWTCIPHLDNACVGREELAAGLRAAAPQHDRRPVTRGVLASLLPAFALGGERTWPVSVSKWPNAQGINTSAGFVCSCGSNRPPDSRYPCSEQAMWGKCEESWMATGYCLGWCHNCAQPVPVSGLSAPGRKPHAWRAHLNLLLTLAVALALVVTLALTVALTVGVVGTLKRRRWSGTRCSS